METGEIIYEKVYVSPPLPPKISFNDNWMKELDSEVAGGSEDSQQIRQPFTQEIEKDVLFGREGTKNSRTVRLVDGPKSIQSCVPVSVQLVDKKTKTKTKT